MSEGEQTVGIKLLGEDVWVFCLPQCVSSQCDICYISLLKNLGGCINS